MTGLLNGLLLSILILAGQITEMKAAGISLQPSRGPQGLNVLSPETRLRLVCTLQDLYSKDNTPYR